MKKLFTWADLFASNLSAAEWAWRIITFLVVVSGGTTAGLLAQGTELFQAVGPFGWFAIAVICALLIAVIFLLVAISRRQIAEAMYLQALSLPRSAINPLAESFTDKIINIPDLYLPLKQIHSNKLFKRCKLVGPGVIAVTGGSYIGTKFIEIGTPIVLPEGAGLTGVLVLDNCTVEDCELINVTLLMDKKVGEALKQIGAPVVGL